jgi:hypothetical protein
MIEETYLLMHNDNFLDSNLISERPFFGVSNDGQSTVSMSHAFCRTSPLKLIQRNPSLRFFPTQFHRTEIAVPRENINPRPLQVHSYGLTQGLNNIFT